MKIGKKLRKMTQCGAILFIALLTLSPPSSGQLVEREYWSQSFISKEYRPRWYDVYENFGSYDMRKYPTMRKLEAGYGKTDYVENPALRGPVSPVAYDQFGNMLLPGGEIFNMSWNRSKLGASQDPADATSATKTEQYRWMNGVFNNLVIATDEFSNWQTRFMIARRPTNISWNGTVPQGGLRAYFTPSTMKITNFSGFRWDASSRKNNVTILASSGDRPTYGVHWQSVLGDILKVGATYVGRQRGTISYSHQDIDGSNPDEYYMKNVPRYVYLVVTDDSPEDTGPGARVFDVKAVVNGKATQIAYADDYDKDYPIKGRVMKIDNLFSQYRYINHEQQRSYMFYMNSATYDQKENSKSNRFNSSYMHMNVEDIRNNRDSWFLSLVRPVNEQGVENAYAYNILKDLFMKSGNLQQMGLLNITEEQWQSSMGNSDSDKYRYDPDDPTGQEYLRHFKADTSNGYIEAQNDDVIIYEFLIPSETRQLSFNVNVANDYCIDIVAPLYSDRQNREAGWFDEPLTDSWNGSWSIPSSLFDMKHCAKASGNVKDQSNQRWVKVNYDRMTGMNVYGLNLEMNWRGLFLRAEYNEYNTFWSYPVNEKLSSGDKNKYTSQAWFVNAEKQFDKWSIGGEVFNYPNEYMQYWAPIDDNDDDDNLVGMTYSGYKIPEYPGLDADFDRILETENQYYQSGNSISRLNNQWDTSSYIGYYFDSVFIGDDFNHDGRIDSREDDTRIDLPYERDSKGQHYFLKIEPKESTKLTFGHYDVRQETSDGRNFTRYMKFEHYHRMPGIGEFTFYHRTERIKDNYNLYSDFTNHNLINQWRFKTILASRVTFVPNTNIINNVSYTTYYQVGNMVRTDGTEQENMISLYSSYYGNSLVSRYGKYALTLEHKADYTLRIADARIIPSVTIGGFRLWKDKRIKELKFMPMIKLVHSYSYAEPNNYDLQTRDRKSRMLHLYPILRVDYQVAPKTKLRLGIQGFSGLEEMYRVRNSGAGKLYDYDKRTMIFALENQTLYEGFNLLVLVGMSFSKQQYIHEPFKTDPGNTEYFITIRSEASGG